MKKLLLILMWIIPVNVYGQVIPIHGHPQKTAYNNQSEWPFISAQGHWKNGMPFIGDVSLTRPDIGHTHVECKAPIYGETNGSMVLECDVVLFHTPGQITIVDSNIRVGIWWHDTNSINPPVMIGDMMGVKKFAFTLFTDPAFGANDWNPHGWTFARVMARTVFADGIHFDVFLLLPFYSIRDLSIPEQVRGQNDAPILGTRVEPHTAWGEVDVETQSMIPLRSINTAWPMIINTYDYGNVVEATTPGIAEMRKDMDLHNGITGQGLTFGVFDPNELGSGLHKTAMIWRHDSGNGNQFFPPHEGVVSLLVIEVEVGNEVHPVLCQDPLATNFGQPLPCVYPVIDWVNITGQLQRLNDTIRICAEDGKCTDPLVIH